MPPRVHMLLFSAILAGCPVDTSSFMAPLCANGGISVDGLSPSAPPDYIELRWQQYNTDNPTDVTVMSSSGTPCATATDQAACRASLSALRVESGFREMCGMGCVRYFLVATTGDTVRAIDSKPGLVTFLGAIDTPQEAVLLAFAEGYAIDCLRKERGAVKQTADGYEVVGTAGDACGVGNNLSQVLLKVTPAGEIIRTGAVVLEVGDANCLN